MLTEIGSVIDWFSLS